MHAHTQELDLRNNALTQLPQRIQRLRALETLLLSFNKIASLESFPWSELASVSVVSVSDNKLRSLGTIYDAPRLASLSFENNNLTHVPCELGLCPHLRALYLNGNPQKTVRGGVIAKGSAEVLAYLKNKFPPNAVLPPPSLSARGGNQDDDEDDEAWIGKKLSLSPSPQTKAPQADAPAALRSARASLDASGRPPRADDSSSNDTMVRKTLVQLTEQIAALECELENHALSAPKRHALKKEVAVLRSTRIREERKLH